MEIKVEKKSLQGQVIEGEDALLTEAEAAQFLRILPRTLRHMRYTGQGPGHVRVSIRQVRYEKKTLLEWVERNRSE